MFRATVDDVVRMMPCARLCCAEHGEERTGGPLNELHYEASWRKLIESNIGVMFLIEDDSQEVVAGIGGAKYQALLTGLSRCKQLFIYVRPDHRGKVSIRRLIRELEVWAVENQSDDILMPLLDSMPIASKEVYERMGYRPLETEYRKSLKGPPL
jgi:GNAT superfamily N-acetyltransferase